MIRMLVFLMALSCATSSVAMATPYWVAYEGNDFPENEGWTRNTNAGGANRWIEDGALVIDSLHNGAIRDSYRIDDIQDPEPGELFVAEWRMLSEEMLFWYDAGVGIVRDASPGYASFYIGLDDVLVFHEWQILAITPQAWHSYRMESADMVDYRLFIDNHLVFTGVFDEFTNLQSFVVWGDLINGAASLARWDYVRFGVVPEPSCLVLALAGIGIAGSSRS